DAAKVATAIWTTQYELQVVTAYGEVSGQGWYDAGSTAVARLALGVVPLTGGTRAAFVSWTGDATGTDPVTSSPTPMTAPRSEDGDGGVEDRVLSPGRLGYRRDSRHRLVPLPGDRDDPGAGSDDERGRDLSVRRLDRGSDFVRQLDHDYDEWADDGSGYVVIDRIARRTLRPRLGPPRPGRRGRPRRCHLPAAAPSTKALRCSTHRSRRASVVFRYRPYVDSMRTPPRKKAPAEHTSRHDSRFPRKSPFVRFAVK